MLPTHKVTRNYLSRFSRRGRCGVSRLRYRPALLAAVLCLSSVIIATAQPLQQARPEAVGFSSERLERIDGIFQRYVDDGKMAGSVIMVLRHGHIAYVNAFGYRDQESQTKMTPNTIFRIASQSKAIVSVGAMILQEKGALLISDPVGKYLPEFNTTSVAVAREDGGYDEVPAKRKITIRDLLTHTSGVSYGGGPGSERWKDAGIQGWYFAGREEPIRETVRRMAALPFDAQPGERWVYGYSLDILGALIEVVSGQPLDEYLEDEIFSPLEMSDTCFYLPTGKKDRLATVYSLSRENGLSETPDVSQMIGQGQYAHGPRMSFSGGAGLLSTANDYARFLQMILSGGILNETRILSRKTVEQMTMNHTGSLFSELDPGNGFGLGFSIRLDQGPQSVPGSTGEYGWGGAYHSTYWVDPVEDMVVTYFTQMIPAGGLDDHAKLRTLIYQAIQD